MSLEGKIAVVTGGSRGIGRAVCLELARQGAAVVFSYAGNTAAARETEAACAAQGRPARGVRADVTDAAAVKALLDGVVKEFGRIDILVNNAGITRDAMFHKMSEAQWDDVICVNLKSMFNCCQAVVPSMRANKYGKIVNLASVSAFGNLGQTNYGASKGGVIGFTKCLARDLARSQCNVNCIAPSYIDTPMLQAVPPETMQRFLQAIPLGRLGTPEELAGAVAFLASDDASFITGECLVVSGGSYM